MRVLLLTRYGHRGGSSRLRAYQYLPYLSEQGIDVTVSSLLPDAYLEDLYQGRRPRWGPILRSYLTRCFRLLAAKPRFDLLWIEYELFPWLPALAERWLSLRGIPYVVDYDDPIYHRYDLHASALVRLVLRKKIDVIMRQATVVIVCNEYLGEQARLAGARRIEFLPTVVNLDRYPQTPASSGPVLTVGWTGSPSTVKYLKAVGPMLADFCRTRNARLVVVGAREAGLKGVPTDVRPWTESTEVQDIVTFDVGIMPLPDEPWERGKCGFKLIQYMACARPVVASPVGVNSQIVEHNVNGFLARTDQEWRSALDALCDATLRTRQGNAGRQRVEALYCTRVTAPRLARILKSAFNGSEH
jgi:glycosyltransferase involved in cell wall biosynthesis